MSTLLYAVVRSRGKEVLESLNIPKGNDSEDEEDNVKQSGTPDSNSDIYLSASTLSHIIVFFPILYSVTRFVAQIITYIEPYRAPLRSHISIWGCSSHLIQSEAVARWLIQSQS
jgi:hypothetical protein